MTWSLAMCRSQRRNGIAGVAQVVLEPAVRLDQHVLHDVAGVDAGGQGRVEAQADHAAQRLAVDVEQAIDRPVLPFAGAGEQILGVGVVAPHGRESLGVAGAYSHSNRRRGWNLPQSAPPLAAGPGPS